jgi:hypothetical protein
MDMMLADGSVVDSAGSLGAMMVLLMAVRKVCLMVASTVAKWAFRLAVD